MFTRADSSSFEAPSPPAHTIFTYTYTYTYAHVYERQFHASSNRLLLFTLFLPTLPPLRSRHRRFSSSTSFFLLLLSMDYFIASVLPEAEADGHRTIYRTELSHIFSIFLSIRSFLATLRSSGKNRRRQDALQTRRTRASLVCFRRNERDGSKSSGPYGSCRYTPDERSSISRNLPPLRCDECGWLVSACRMMARTENAMEKRNARAKGLLSIKKLGSGISRAFDFTLQDLNYSIYNFKYRCAEY